MFYDGLRPAVFNGGASVPSVPIASFDNDEQLAAGMGSVEAPVDPQVMEALRRVKKLSMDC